ncbi:MAG: bifunctional oligoribonuclease/PAP phosphatase NrnA [Planctomycetota bacterium]
MSTSGVPADALQAVRAARRIVIASHIPMDGDGLGTGLALMRALRPSKDAVHLVTPGYVPRVYTFLAGYDEIVKLGGDQPVPDCDLLLALDAGNAERLGRVLTDRPEGARVLNVDHHISNTLYGDVNWVDAAAGATAELGYLLLVELGVEIDAQAAQALLVALVTDTGRFCYSSTRPRTLEIGAALLRLGADPDMLNLHLYRSIPRGVLDLHARAVQRIAFHADGALALLTVEADFGSDLGVDEEDQKDLVDIPVSVEGVVVAGLFRGLKDGGTKVSLRSNSDAADVAAFAAACGGGGHVRAAGYPSAEGPAQTARAALKGLMQMAAAVSPGR